MGEDTQGNVFPSVQGFWNTTLNSKEREKTWYDTTLAYWEKSEPSINGVLSGHSYLSDADLKGSDIFLKCLKSKVTAQDQTDMFAYVIDCGAGIGRITNGCLVHHFQKCDLLEPVQHLLDTAKKELHSISNVKNFYCVSLENFFPEPNVYSCFWLQWCVLYLTDKDLISCLIRLRQALKPKGFICIKENVILKGKMFFWDRSDNSLMRTESHYLQIFEKAGFKVFLSMQQTNYPKYLIPVMMYCLVPKTCAELN